MTAVNQFQALNSCGFAVLSAGVTNHVVDASNEGVAFAFMSETSSAITKLWFRYGLRVGTPPTYRISLQSLGTTGLPDGTVLGGGSPASATFTPPADTTWDGTGQWITLTNSYTPSLGQVMCSVIEYSSGTIDGSNNSSFTRAFSGLQSTVTGVPYVLTNTGGTWSKLGSSIGPFAYGTASTKHGMPAVGTYSTTQSTTGRRSACGITLPTAMGSTYSPSGFSCCGRLGATGSTGRFSVWNDSGTELATTGDIDSDHLAAVASECNIRAIFTTRPTLSYGTKYYFGVESVSSSAVGVRGITLTEASDRQAYPSGEVRHLGVWDGASWTDTTTTLPWVELIFDDITAAAGSSGGIVIGS